jgi:hypothetical protein
MKIDGRCHGGYITYEADIDPEKILICHCADCQTFFGLRVPRGRLHSGRCIQVAFGRAGRRLDQGPKFTPFAWAPFVNAINSYHRP